MPDLLRDEDSSDRHLQAVYRHQRLVRRIKGGAAFADRIEAPRKKLEATQRKRLDAELAVDVAQDDLKLRDEELDDRVQTAFERARQYDREHLGEAVQAMLFPDGKFTPITMATAGTAQPDLVEQLVARLEKLADSHPLREGIEGLRQGAMECRQAEAALRTAKQTHGLARADEELEQGTVRAQYEANYLDLRKQFGKKLAERLFPKIHTRGRAKGQVEPEPEAPVQS
jgi:hypothetical protein